MNAKRIELVQAPVIPIVAGWTLEHPGTISLGQGIVHYPPPSEVFDAVAGVRGAPDLDRYGSVIGATALHDKIVRKVEQDNGIGFTDENAIVVSAGANMAFINAILAIADVGDEVVLLSPYYFNHHMAIEIAGCRVVAVPTDSDYQPDLDAIKDSLTPRTRAIVTVSPNNPTGAVYSSAMLNEINELCGQRGLYHISDEAYEYFTYGTPHFSPGSISGSAPHTFSLFSLSKSYGMAGWRIGYSVVPSHLLDSMKKVQDTNLICPPMVCQVAAEAALTCGSNWCRDRASQFESVRTAAIESLSSLGSKCRVVPAHGAFYLFLKLESERPDMELVESLIREHRVAVLPGSAFGASDCSIRISFGALEADTVREGIGRLCRGLHELL